MQVDNKTTLIHNNKYQVFMVKISPTATTIIITNTVKTTPTPTIINKPRQSIINNNKLHCREGKIEMVAFNRHNNKIVSSNTTLQQPNSNNKMNI